MCPLRWNQDPLPRLHCRFLAASPLSLHLLPSLINNSLNLCIGNSGKVLRACVHACTYACSIAQLCPTLGGPGDCSPPGSSVHGIIQNPGVGTNFLLQWIFLTTEIKAEIKPASPALSGGFFTTEPLGKPQEISQRVNRKGFFHTQEAHGVLLGFSTYFVPSLVLKTVVF